MDPAQHLGPEALTRDEAKVRAALISDPEYTVALDLTTGDQTFTSETTVTFKCSRPGAATLIDLMTRSMTSMELNSRAIPTDAHNGHRNDLEDLQPENTLPVRRT